MCDGRVSLASPPVFSASVCGSVWTRNQGICPRTQDVNNDQHQISGPYSWSLPGKSWSVLWITSWNKFCTRLREQFHSVINGGWLDYLVSPNWVRSWRSITSITSNTMMSTMYRPSRITRRSVVPLHYMNPCKHRSCFLMVTNHTLTNNSNLETTNNKLFPFPFTF